MWKLNHCAEGLKEPGLDREEIDNGHKTTTIDKHLQHWGTELELYWYPILYFQLTSSSCAHWGPLSINSTNNKQW